MVSAFVSCIQRMSTLCVFMRRNSMSYFPFSYRPSTFQNTTWNFRSLPPIGVLLCVLLGVICCVGRSTWCLHHDVLELLVAGACLVDECVVRVTCDGLYSTLCGRGGGWARVSLPSSFIWLDHCLYCLRDSALFSLNRFHLWFLACSDLGCVFLCSASSRLLCCC